MNLVLQGVSRRTFSSQLRLLRSLPINTIIKFVPQQEAWICERMGKFDRTLPVNKQLLII
jgi:regulator of protease activity HflC (stomatin/prohibitin superfamily)